jgi:hypothetical protein
MSAPDSLSEIIRRAVAFFCAGFALSVVAIGYPWREVTLPDNQKGESGREIS